MIIQQPYYEILPAYRPVAFETMVTTEDAFYINTVAFVTVYKDGVILVSNVICHSSRNQPSTVVGETDYFFEIDIQKFCQDSLAPDADLTSTFTDFGSKVLDNPDCYGDYHIYVQYYSIDVLTGLLVADPNISIDISNDFTVTIASLQHQESMNLIDYYGLFGPQDGLFLTKSARTMQVAKSETSYLSYLQPITVYPQHSILVTLLSSNLSFLGYGLSVNPLITASNEQLTINTGFDSLASLTYDDGAPVFTNPAIAYYNITAGYGSFGGGIWSFVPHTETFLYEIVSECGSSKALRFHWLNLLGGVDSYTFDGSKDLVIITKSDTATKALDWAIGSISPHNLNDVGNMKINSQGKTAYRITSKILSNSQALWLNELLTSPKVYAEIDGNLIPVKIQDLTQSITRNTGKIVFDFVAELANDRIIQRI